MQQKMTKNKKDILSSVIVDDIIKQIQNKKKMIQKQGSVSDRPQSACFLNNKTQQSQQFNQTESKIIQESVNQTNMTQSRQSGGFENQKIFSQSQKKYIRIGKLQCFELLDQDYPNLTLDEMKKKDKDNFFNPINSIKAFKSFKDYIGESYICDGDQQISSSNSEKLKTPFSKLIQMNNILKKLKLQQHIPIIKKKEQQKRNLLIDKDISKFDNTYHKKLNVYIEQQMKKTTYPESYYKLQSQKGQKIKDKGQDVDFRKFNQNYSYKINKLCSNFHIASNGYKVWDKQLQKHVKQAVFHNRKINPHYQKVNYSFQNNLQSKYNKKLQRSVHSRTCQGSNDLVRSGTIQSFKNNLVLSQQLNRIERIGTCQSLDK